MRILFMLFSLALNAANFAQKIVDLSYPELLQHTARLLSFHTHGIGQSLNARPDYAEALWIKAHMPLPPQKIVPGSPGATIFAYAALQAHNTAVLNLSCLEKTNPLPQYLERKAHHMLRSMLYVSYCSRAKFSLHSAHTKLYVTLWLLHDKDLLLQALPHCPLQTLLRKHIEQLETFQHYSSKLIFTTYVLKFHATELLSQNALDFERLDIPPIPEPGLQTLIPLEVGQLEHTAQEILHQIRQCFASINTPQEHIDCIVASVKCATRACKKASDYMSSYLQDQDHIRACMQDALYALRHMHTGTKPPEKGSHAPYIDQELNSLMDIATWLSDSKDFITKHMKNSHEQTLFLKKIEELNEFLEKWKHMLKHTHKTEWAEHIATHPKYTTYTRHLWELSHQIHYSAVRGTLAPQLPHLDHLVQKPQSDIIQHFIQAQLIHIETWKNYAHSLALPHALAEIRQLQEMAMGHQYFPISDIDEHPQLRPFLRPDQKHAKIVPQRQCF